MRSDEAQPYDAAFYADQVDGSARSAAVILPIVFGLLRPARVIDIGCGQGAWLAAAGALGATSLTGLDGDWVDRARLKSPAITFHATDLSRPILEPGAHDLCISVEVAEHLPPERADGFVEDLCRSSPVVLFSAAAPRQGGTEHRNEERASRWIARFAERSYDCFDIVRGAVWDDPRVEWWYRQNCLVFVSQGTPQHSLLTAAPRAAMPRDLVHPDAFESKVAYLEAERLRMSAWIDHPTLGQALRALWRAITGGAR